MLGGEKQAASLAPTTRGENHILPDSAQPLTTKSKRDGESDHEPSDVTTILKCLKGADKLHVDSIIDGSGLTVATVLKLLLELELKGIVVQHPGKFFSLSSI